MFRVTQGKLIGAIYYPYSEFSCFYGSIAHRNLNLSIIDPYEQTIYPYAIALKPLSPIATEEGLNFSFGLVGYKQLSVISDNDQRMLNVCLGEIRNLNDP